MFCFIPAKNKNIGLRWCNIFFGFIPLIECLRSKFHHLILANFGLPTSFGMSHHHLHEKKITGGTPKKYITWGKLKKKILQGVINLYYRG
jgi:hypothetical protein